MTSIYDENGKNIPCTIIEAGPCVVTQVKTREVDGYNSVQLSYGETSEKNISKSRLNHFRKAKTSVKRKLHEFQNYENDYKLGDKINVDHFIEGEFVDVSGISKGKGFQGVVKRHGFAGVGQATHGQHNRLRAPGSIGAASYPARVFKGMRMAGQTGNKKNTIQNLRVLKVVLEKNIILLKGCVPGYKNSYIIISK
jgi:large subunit ribosomal protein L3